MLIATVSACTTAALTYRQARTSVLESAQDTAVSSFREQVQQASLPLPARAESLRAVLRNIASKSKPHPWVVFADYGSLRVSSGSLTESTVITAELRRAAEAGDEGGFQRVVKDGEPYLTIALPTVLAVGPGRTLNAGMTFFAVMRLTDEEANVHALLLAARDGALPGLAFAFVPALLTARGVLRPVRELRQAARNMGSGRFGARIPMRGNDEMAQLAREFNDSAERLERTVRELREAEVRARRFASDVSHELRTPLTGMLAVTDVLEEDASRLDPDTAQAVRLVSSETVKLAVLVDDLIEISRFDARAAELNTDEVDPAETVLKSLRNRHWAEDCVRTELAHGLRARLDPRRFDIVVANLVGNALRHGGAPVTVRLTSTSTSCGAPALVMQVLDSGPGIRSDVFPHIFDRFYKADAARGRSAGSGLGLAIALENVRLHGGTIHASNVTNGGAMFTVELPLHPPGTPA